MNPLISAEKDSGICLASIIFEHHALC